jgi:hypothetical protein
MRIKKEEVEAVLTSKIDNGAGCSQFNLIHYPCYLIDLHFVSSSIIGSDLGFHLIHPRQWSQLISRSDANDETSKEQIVQ